MRTRLRGKISLLCMTFGLLLAFPAVALAADVINADLIDFTSQNATYTAGDANGVRTAYWVEADNDGCDPADGGALSFKLKAIRQSDNTVVTSSSFKARLSTDAVGSEQTLNNFTLSFDKCSTAANNQAPNNTKTVIFTSDANLAAGQYKIEVDTSAASINDTNDPDNEYSASNQNSFHINVSAPAAADADGDGVADDADNCPNTANASQADADADGQGDACDSDRDGDGVNNPTDNCPDAANSNQADADGDGIGNVCDPTPNPSDTTPPVIDYTLNPANPDGLNGWYTSNVSLTWTVTDPESSASIVKTGCVNQNIISDQQETTYSCSATSDGGSAGPVTVSIKRDATAPTGVAGSPDRAPDHNGWYNHAVPFTFTGQDATSGIASCSTPTYSGPDGTGKTVDGRCTDEAGNQSALVPSSPIDYDATPPTNITFSGISNGDSFDFGDVPALSSLGCSATDVTSGFASCNITGYSDAVSNTPHTLTATATDNAGNSAQKTLSYSVVAWTLKGFYPPVDMGIHNTMKAGQTVALKFEIFKTLSGQELTDTSVIKTFTQKVNCTTSGGVDAIEEFATGSTALRYDTTSGQFIFNWKSPKSPGTCYRVTMTTQDGSSILADFTLK